MFWYVIGFCRCVRGFVCGVSGLKKIIFVIVRVVSSGIIC